MFGSQNLNNYNKYKAQGLSLTVGVDINLQEVICNPKFVSYTRLYLTCEQLQLNAMSENWIIEDKTNTCFLSVIKLIND